MIQHTRTYSLVVEPHPDDGGYLASFPALPGCHTWAETYQEAVANAEEVLLGYLEALQKNGEEVPIEQAPAKDVSLGVTVKLPEPA
jgi:predicted RNase H-like HicB family nuclease